MRLLCKFFVILLLCGVASGQDEAGRLTAQVQQLFQEGRYTEALPLAERVLVSREKSLPAGHPVIGAAHFTIAEAQRLLGNAKPAEDSYLRAIAIWEKTLPEEEIVLLARACNNLALIYAGRATVTHAEPLYQKTLAIYEKLYGAEHPDIAQTLNNLALLYRAAGQLGRAAPFAQRALDMCVKNGGPDNLTTAGPRNTLGLIYAAQGDLPRAAEFVGKALEIWDKRLGPEHPNTLTALGSLAEIYRLKGDLNRAEPLYQRILAAYDKLAGPNSAVSAGALLHLAEIYRQRGRYDESEKLYRRALSAVEQNLGPQHPDTATVRNNLGIVLKAKGDHAQAEKLFQAVLATYEKTLGPEHENVAQALNNLAETYRDQGQFDRAGPLLQRALSIVTKKFGANHEQTALLLNNIGLLYENKGEYARAEEFFQRAAQSYEKSVGPEHPHIATLHNNLGEVYRNQGDFPRAETSYRRALALFEKNFGAEHPNTAQTHSNFGILYYSTGDYERSEQSFRRALGIWEKTLGPAHPYVATVINNLGELYREKGDYERAAAHFKRALALYEQAFGPTHPNVGQSFNNIANLFYAIGLYDEAEPRYQRALAIYEKTLGPAHPNVAMTLNNLALLYRAQGRYALAEPLLQKALALTEKNLGAQHTSVAQTLSNLSQLYFAQGEVTKAVAFMERAAAISEKALGETHPETAQKFAGLAAMYARQGDEKRAVALQQRAQTLLERNLDTVIASGSEKDKQLYLDKFSGATDIAIALHLQKFPSNPAAAQLALTAILQRKGRALDAMTNQIAALRQRAAPADQKLLDQLAATQSRYAKLQLANDTPRATLEQLAAEIERLEAEVSSRSKEFRAANQPITLEAVLKALPADAALVEIFSYQPFDDTAQELKDRFQPAQYVAYVLRRESPVPQFAVLGTAAKLDAQVVNFRQLLGALPPRNKGESDDAWQTRVAQYEQKVKEAGRQLDEQLMRPVRRLLGSAKRVFLAPDGALNLIPFNALVDENGRYLIEHYAFNYLTSGRDLLRLNAVAGSQNPPVVLANPVYDLRLGQSANQSVTARRSADFAAFEYAPLPGTAAEAQALQGLMPDAQVLTQAQATEAALKKLSAPRLLHIATHGFFLNDLPQTNEAARNIGLAAGAPTARRATENPLLRSGIVLAGVKQQRSGAGEDGVLTALETAGLNLWGTRLVVLSACETGLGEARNGAGVYGLRRALVLAGSETQVMSLWQVSDAATRDLMIAYYKLLQANAGRVEALRQVQLAMLRGDIAGLGGKAQPQVKLNTRHPYFWAAFIVSGDWKTLDAQEPKKP